jgi:hypothetical protein
MRSDKSRQLLIFASGQGRRCIANGEFFDAAGSGQAFFRTHHHAFATTVLQPK